MKLSQEQQRVKELLSDTITRLCLSGLAFKTEFTIEALVGITLDNTDVILININETVARTVSKTNQPICEEPPPVSGTVTGKSSFVCTESVRCSTSNVSPVSVSVMPVKCTRASAGKITPKLAASVSSTPLIDLSKPVVVDNSSTKTYVKILPKEVNLQESSKAICSVPLIVTMSRKGRGRGRRKRNSNQEVKTLTKSHTVSNSAVSLPNASEPCEYSKTSSGSNDSDFLTLNNSTRQLTDGGVCVINAAGESFVVKAEPIDNDYNSSLEEDNMIPGFSLEDSADRSSYDTQMQDTGADEMDEHDAYVRDICINEHRQSQSVISESMQEDKKEFSTPEQQLPDERTRGSSGADISKRSQAQIRRRQGLPYINGKGEFIGGKELKPQNCSRCKLRCAEKLSEADRVEIFNHFWRMGPQQAAFVQSYVREVPVQFLTLGHQSRRSRTLQYFLPAGHEKVKVCRDMFLNTLNLSVNTLYTKLAKV